MNARTDIPTIANAVRQYGDAWNVRVFAQLVSAQQYARASAWSALVDMPRDQTRDELRMDHCTRHGRHWQVDYHQLADEPRA